MKYRDPDFSWGWVRTLSAAGGSWPAGTPRQDSDTQTYTPAQAPLTAVQDVAHDVPGDPQLFHVAWSQDGPWGCPSRARPGLLRVPAAEEAPHDRGYGPGLWCALGRVAQPQGLEQSGGRAWGHRGAGQERRGQQQGQEKKDMMVWTAE